MEKVKPEPELRLTMLLHDIGKPNCFTVDGLGCGHFYGHPAESARMAEAMLGRLRAETVLRETVVQLVAWHDRNIPRTRPGVARALGALGERDLRRLLDVKRADNLAQAPAYRFLQGEIDRAECILDQLLVEGACVSLRQLAVNGRDLLAMGLSGPAVGQTLRELLNAVLDDSLPNERHALLVLSGIGHTEAEGNGKEKPRTHTCARGFWYELGEGEAIRTGAAVPPPGGGRWSPGPPSPAVPAGRERTPARR